MNQTMSLNEERLPNQGEDVVQVEPVELQTSLEKVESKAEQESPVISSNNNTTMLPPSDAQHVEGWRLYTLIFG